MLKDWKHYSKNIWKNIKKDLSFEEQLYSTIKIDKVEVPSSAFGSKFEKNYRVSFKNKNGTIENRAEYFKTKSQALRFAKAYMMKH